MAIDFGLGALIIAIVSAGASYMQAKKAQKKAKEMTQGLRLTSSLTQKKPCCIR